MKLGIGTYTYPWSIGVPGYPAPRHPVGPIGLLQKARELGVDLVQFADNLPLDQLSSSEVARLGASAREMGLALEVGTRGVAPQHLRQYLQIAKALGARLVRTLIHAPGSAPDLSTAAAWLAEVLPEYAEAQVQLAIENHDRYQARELAHLVQSLESPFVGICLDTVNSFGALEGPEYVIGVLAPYTVNLHFKDFEITRVPHMMGFEIRGCPAGKGRLDGPALLRALAEHGRRPNVILELWTPYLGEIESTIRSEAEWAVESVLYLRRLLTGA